MTDNDVSHEGRREHEELVYQVAEACRILGKLDLTHYAFGHVSYKVGEDRLLIKGKGPTEVGLRFTGPDDIIMIDHEARTIDGKEGLRAPSEAFLHIWLHRTNPDIRSVIHVHPPSAVLLTICDVPIEPIYGAFGPGVQMAIDGVPVYPRSVRISDHTLGEEFASFMAGRTHTLMRGHGVTVAGDSIEDAMVRTLTLDELTTMCHQAHLLGGARRIPDEDVAVFSEPIAADRPRGSAGGRSGILAAYRYYRMLAGEGG